MLCPFMVPVEKVAANQKCKTKKNELMAVDRRGTRSARSSTTTTI